MSTTKLVLLASLLVIFGSTQQLYAFPTESHIANVYWAQANYPVENTKAKIIIDEQDMNKFPQSIDRFNIQVYSDSDNTGITIRITENSINSGIFEAIVILTNGPTKENRLHILDGDTLTAKYIDTTLPKDQTVKDLEITGTAFVGSRGPPLERVPVSYMRVYDTKGNNLDEISLDQQAEIIIDLENAQDRSQKFAYLVQIQNERGEFVSLSWIDGMLDPLQALSPSVSWTPKTAGLYTATVFVWESIDNPTALSPPKSQDLKVVPKLFDIEKFQNEPFVKINLIDYTYSYSSKKPIEFGVNLKGSGYGLHPPKITIKDKTGKLFWSNADFVEKASLHATKGYFDRNYSMEELGGPLKLPIGKYILTAKFGDTQIRKDLTIE